MDTYETNLETVYAAVERYVKYRLNGIADAEDVLQDVCLMGYLKYGQLKNKGAFKAWMLTIARNKCNDYFRRVGQSREVPLDAVPEADLVYGCQGWVVNTLVVETMEQLNPRDREVLDLFYLKELSLAEIAGELQIPVGTVKSRLNMARTRFRNQYPYPLKGDKNMTKLPKKVPDYKIEYLEKEPFAVKWEELPGWLVIPKLGEALIWGLYEYPSMEQTEYTEIKVTGKVEVHGIEGVEMSAVQYGADDYYRTGCINRIERRFAAQLTDTYCRFLAESHEENGVRKCYTFLDGEAFLNNWGFGEDNCGKEVNLYYKGLLHRKADIVTSANEKVADIVGRYGVTINGKTYDTVCVMDIACFEDAVATEQYIDQNGRTVLWRRYNRDDWALEHFGGKPWSEQLPDNHRLTINGYTYVHWYDCITDYIFG